jgi:hypothetical protein
MVSEGRWRGYWEQAPWGRQPMEDLTLRFSDGAIVGEGWDMVGRFLFRGTIDAGGKVHLIKKYLGQHEVIYEGDYDGEGTIYGTWSIPPFCSGAFMLMADRQARPRDEAIRDL